METKDYILEFLLERSNTTRFEEVTDVILKDCDDSHGGAGEHYIVTVKVHIPDFSFTSGNQTKIVEMKCLVNVKQFNQFVEKRNAIIWL
jgi:hypothetical protein